MTTSMTMPTLEMPCVTEGIPLAWERRCRSMAIAGGGTAGLVRDEVIQIAERSVAHWTEVSCGGARVDLEVTVIEEPSRCDLAQFNHEGGNVSTIAFVSFDERDLEPSAFAFTTVWHNTITGRILDVDIEINEDRGPFGVCPEPDGCTRGEMVDLENVLTHEIGHTFGLAHSTDSSATMFAVSPPGEIAKRTLEADDIAGLCEIYPPGTLPTECDETPHGGVNLDCFVEPTCCTIAPGARPHRPWSLAVTLLAAVLIIRRSWRRRRRGRR